MDGDGGGKVAERRMKFSKTVSAVEALTHLQLSARCGKITLR